MYIYIYIYTHTSNWVVSLGGVLARKADAFGRERFSVCLQLRVFLLNINNNLNYKLLCLAVGLAAWVAGCLRTVQLYR